MIIGKEEEELINELTEKINEIRRSSLGNDQLAMEIIRAIAITLNALKRYVRYLDSGRRSDRSYLVELIQTAIDSLKRFLWELQKKKN